MAGVFLVKRGQFPVQHGLDALQCTAHRVGMALVGEAGAQVVRAQLGVGRHLPRNAAVLYRELAPRFIDPDDAPALVNHHNLVGHRIEHGLCKGLALVQALLGQRFFNGDAGQPGGLFDQGNVGRAGVVGATVVNAKSAQNPVGA